MEKLVWTTRRVKVSELKIWEENPRTLDEKGFNDIKDSLEEDGDWGVIVCDIDLTIISGTQRLRAKISAALPKKDLDCVLEAFEKVGRRMGVIGKGQIPSGVTGSEPVTAK